MTLRMKSKEQIEIQYNLDPFTEQRVEKVVYVIRDNKTEEFIVSETPQTILGYHPHKRYERIYTGPYSKWDGQREPS